MLELVELMFSYLYDWLAWYHFVSACARSIVGTMIVFRHDSLWMIIPEEAVLFFLFLV